jgi:hypothetical protein
MRTTVFNEIVYRTEANWIIILRGRLYQLTMNQTSEDSDAHLQKAISERTHYNPSAHTSKKFSRHYKSRMEGAAYLHPHFSLDESILAAFSFHHILHCLRSFTPPLHW